MDFNIDNYNLEDIVKMFKINPDFDETDLRNAKRIVLRMHPDKSRLPTKYFIFYSKAYKVLFSVYEFKNKSINKKGEETYTADFSKDKSIVLDQFFDINKNIGKNPKDFNSWFNKEFEKNKLSNESDDLGYGEWLRSEEDIKPEKNISQAEMAKEFDKIKKEARALIIHKDVTEMYANNFAGSSLSNKAPELYTSDVFSNLSYQDLKQAHTESVIPITEEDYHNIKKFNNVNEYVSYRNGQNIKPLSGTQLLEYLKNKKDIDDQEASKRAYDLAKQLEQVKQNSKSFWGNIMKITDK